MAKRTLKKEVTGPGEGSSYVVSSKSGCGQNGVVPAHKVKTVILNSAVKRESSVGGIRQDKGGPSKKPVMPPLVPRPSRHRIKTKPEDIKAVYRDHTMAAIHEAMEDLVCLGLVDPGEMKAFNAAALRPAKSFEPARIKAIRKRENASQVVFARYLGVSVNTIGQWERGERQATGTAATLLGLVDRFGLAYIR